MYMEKKYLHVSYLGSVCTMFSFFHQMSSRYVHMCGWEVARFVCWDPYESRETTAPQDTDLPQTSEVMSSDLSSQQRAHGVAGRLGLLHSVHTHTHTAQWYDE